MKVVTLVGARPQFIKAAMVSRAFAQHSIEEIIVHSGQHYDEKVSQVFFDELEIPKPSVNLQVGSGTHATQTGHIMERFEAFLVGLDSVDWVLVYGDTNTTIAGAMVAAKLRVPLAHVEAGLRSFNRYMPEEINRLVTDRLSDLLFCPTDTAIQNLMDEGITAGVHLGGDVMYDATLHFSNLAGQKVERSMVDNLEEGAFYLATVHRASNTDDARRLQQIFNAFGRLNAPVLIPLHPRTNAKVKGISIPANIRLCDPVGYLEMLFFLRHCKAVLTDSGGVQKEAFWLKKPCITLREETEWVETLHGNWNQLVGADENAILAAVAQTPPMEADQKMFGLPDEGTASSFIANTLLAAPNAHSYKSI